jgi:hypothetical protein
VTSSDNPRNTLAAALLAGAAPELRLTVWASEHGTPPASPALIVRPGVPYRTESPDAGAYGLAERWRLEVVALVAIDTVDSLDLLDELVTLARDVVRATPAATFNGVQQAPAVAVIGAKSYHGAIVVLDVDV